MRCRAGCGACCIAVSISSAIPGMAEGKPAGIRCVQLSHDNLCRLYGHPDRPAICAAMQANVETCGMSAQEAFANLLRLEVLRFLFDELVFQNVADQIDDRGKAEFCHQACPVCRNRRRF